MDYQALADSYIRQGHQHDIGNHAAAQAEYAVRAQLEAQARIEQAIRQQNRYAVPTAAVVGGLAGYAMGQQAQVPTPDRLRRRLEHLMAREEWLYQKLSSSRWLRRTRQAELTLVQGHIQTTQALLADYEAAEDIIDI